MRYWQRLNKDGSINTVESYSHDLDVEGAVEITEKRYLTFIKKLPVLPEPERRDLLRVIEEIEERLKILEGL